MSGFPNRKSFARGLKAGNSNARGFDLEDIANLPRLSTLDSSVGTKKGYWFTSYAIQQNFVQSEQNPEVGWGLFTLVTLSDGNPNPVKWSVLAGLGGNNLLAGRENHRWEADKTAVAIALDGRHP
jgi:porin